MIPVVGIRNTQHYIKIPCVGLNTTQGIIM